MTTHPFARTTRAAIACAAVTVLTACSDPAPPAETSTQNVLTRPEVVTLGDAAIRNAEITVEPVQTRTRFDQTVAPGLMAIDETRTARVGSLQEGLILETRAQVGDRVRPQQMLATLHGHAMHDAWAGYRKAIADERRLEKELAYAVEAHERATRLYADKAISLQELQRAEVDRVSAAQMVDAAKAEVNRSIEELEHVGVSPETSVEDDPNNPDDESSEEIPVRSPIGGVVLERLVTPGTTVIPGTPLFVISDLSTLWAVAEIDESHLSQVRTGRSVGVRVAAYPNEVFPGTITFIADTVSSTTRRVTIRSTVPNGDGRLKPEMFATVTLGESEPREMIVVPHDAIQTLDGHPAVFVAEAGGRFRPRTVTIGPEADGLVEVSSGLTAGERIVVGGSFMLKSELLAPSADGGQ